MSATEGLLATADGQVFRGKSVGADGVSTGEAVFNTSMTGYLEILTDPSYAGQVVVMTASHIGNYGVTTNDEQSARAQVAGLVVRALSRTDSNWQSEGSLAGFLREQGVVALADVDTRRLTRHIRDHGAMPVAIGAGVDERELIETAAAAPTMEGQDLAAKVSPTTRHHVSSGQTGADTIVAIDLGMKADITRNLTDRGFDVEVVPYRTTADEIMDIGPKGVFISNGPGDPEPLSDTVATLRSLLGKVPIFGICLGHQVLGRAVGAATFKMPFGHHGGNHPVRRIDDGRIEITAQNHGFAVDLWSLSDDSPPLRKGLVTSELLPERVDSDFGEIRPTHQNLNDGTLEGMSMPDAGAFSVQYHPEAAPGPHDAGPLFDEFVSLVEEGL